MPIAKWFNPRISFDMFSPEVQQNPYPYYRELRRHAPVYHCKKYDHWIVSRYADVATVLKRADLFSSTILAPLESTLLGADAPGHPRVRKAFAAAFTRQRIAVYRQAIEMHTTRCLDQILPRGQCNLMPDFAIPLPISVIATVMGFPTDRHADYKRWSDAAVFEDLGTLTPAEQQPYKDSLQEFFAFLEQHLQNSRDQADQQDTLSALIVTVAEQEKFTQEQTLNLAKLLFAAGHESTTALIGNAVLALLKNPAQMEAIRENPGLIPAMVEEALRNESPVQFVRRRAVKAVEIAGVQIPAGAQVFALIGSANRDETEFPEPDRFDIRRAPRTHLVFGYGPHYCIGAQLSRMEASIAFEKLFSQLKSLQAAQSLDEVEYLDLLQLRVLKCLELIFESA